jgi:hypothetical protein
MKIRYRLAAIASAVALTGASALASAGTASAATDFAWCSNDNGYCLLSAGSGHPVKTTLLGNPTNFVSENGIQTNGHDYVEYAQYGTNACLTDSGANVYLQTCSKGDTREMWWYDASPGYLVNDYATVHYGHNECMAQNEGSGDAVIVTACSGGNLYLSWFQF